MTDVSRPTRPPPPTTGFEAHAARGAFNAAFFGVMGPYLEWNLRRHKRRVFADLPRTVVELGAGVGANLRYLPAGIDARRRRTQPPHAPTAAGRRRPPRRAPRPARARRRAHRPPRPQRRQRDLLARALHRHRPRRGPRRDPSHPAPRRHLPLRRARRRARPAPRRVPSNERCAGRGPGPSRAARANGTWPRSLRAAGFARVDVEPYRLHTPFVSFNTQIAGVAQA